MNQPPQQAPTYPIQQLGPSSTAEQQSAALQATIEQLIKEGMSPTEAGQAAQQMIQALQQQAPPQDPSAGFSTRKSTNYGQFMRGGGGNMGDSSGANSVPNPRLNNFNPIRSDGNVANR